MKKTTKILSILLAAAMLLGLCAGLASAETVNVTNAEMLEAEAWYVVYYECEAEMRSLLLPDKDFADFEEWIERLEVNISNASKSKAFQRESDGMYVWPFEEYEMVEQAQAVFAEYFGEEYAAKCAEFASLFKHRAIDSPHFNMYAWSFIPSMPGALLTQSYNYDSETGKLTYFYNNQNGVYDAKVWSEFADLRGKRYDRESYYNGTVDGLIEYCKIERDFHQSLNAILSSCGPLEYFESYVYSLPLGFFRTLLTPVIKLAVRVRNLFSRF